MSQPPENRATMHLSLADLGPSPQHPLPRRASPETSITLRNHRLAREASQRPQAPQPIFHPDINVASPRRDSSGESNDTGHSDPTKWFDRTNRNPTAAYDSHTIDVDPPFFQKKAVSPYEEEPQYGADLMPPSHGRAAAESSSADDFRSVIDDLTIEITRLKEKLKRHKQFGPDTMKKDKLFEVKVHGLSKKQKRELESTLRDFAAGLAETTSADTSGSSERKKSTRHSGRMYSSSGSMSKQTSSAGSRTRPVDSAYASASIGHNSSGTSHGRPSLTSGHSRSSEQKVQNYLRDMPEGLYPRPAAMTDKEKKKTVVRRLEQIFTGKITGRAIITESLALNAGNKNPTSSRVDSYVPRPAHPLPPPPAPPPQLPTLLGSEASREAKMLPRGIPGGPSSKNRSGENLSISKSNGEDNAGNGPGGFHVPKPITPLPEQRPTRPRDLDPDRVQVPSENMEYLRHLGLVPPELLQGAQASIHDVAADADGWVYLNLLCNMAQLHIFNVTPDFIRSAVSEKSTKFQLSPDGNQIRWRGGCEGTRFSSDSSGDMSQQSPLTDETESSEKGTRRAKRQKIGTSGDDIASAPSSKNTHQKFHSQVSQYSTSTFHYKPLFVHHTSSLATSADDQSSCDQNEDSYMEESRWGQSGSGSAPRKKRRVDGAIIYYNNNSPFFIDLSGDFGDMSPTTYMASAGLGETESRSTRIEALRRIVPVRTTSGSSLKSRPLSDGPEAVRADDDTGSPDSDDEKDIEMDFPWSDTPQFLEIQPLEPCGLGGVYPEDSFMVVVTTERPRTGPEINRSLGKKRKSNETAESIIGQIASMSAWPTKFSPSHREANGGQMGRVEIKYIDGRIKRLNPASLPPPSMFLPPFSTDDSDSSASDLCSSLEKEATEGTGGMEEVSSRQANPHQSDNGYPDDVGISSADEVGEELDDEMVIDDLADESIDEAQRLPPLRDAGLISKGSSAATAGGFESGYNSSAEESSSTT